MTKLTKMSCIFLFFVFGTAALRAGMPVQKGAGYSIRVDETNQNILKVTARMNLADNVLYMSENGAGQFPERWAKFVRNLRVVDMRHRPLNVTALEGARWKIDAPKGLAVILNYEISLEHEKHKWSGGIDGAAFARPWGVFYTGRSFLIMNGTERENIKLDFKLPKDWKVSGSWKQVKSNSFIANNLEDLSESMFFAGTHTEFSIKRNGFELLFAIGGEKIVARRDEFESLASGVMDYYIELMGGIPNLPPGRDFNKVIVIINSGENADGEVIGSHINMIFNPDGGPQSETISKFIFAHEFFHLWNGKSILAAETTEEWFKEGVTSYYTLKALYNVGAINDAGYFAILNNLFYQRYSNDSGYAKSSMRDVAEGFSKGEHWGLIYGGGLFVGLCEDVDIRTSTGNKTSLDDLMRQYYQSYSGTTNTYATETVRDSIAKLGGRNTKDFFSNHVFGIKPVPVAECLNNAGFEAKVIDGQLSVSRNQEATPLQKQVIEGVMGAR